MRRCSCGSHARAHERTCDLNDPPDPIELTVLPCLAAIFDCYVCDESIAVHAFANEIGGDIDAPFKCPECETEIDHEDLKRAVLEVFQFRKQDAKKP